jgi:hypothetical protein
MQISTVKQEALAPEQTAGSGLADHLIELPDSQWAFWRCVGLRGAGFPAQVVLRLSASQALMDAADAVLQAEHAVESIRGRALAEVNKVLDLLRKNGQWEDKSKRMPLVDGLQKLKIGNLPESALEVGDSGVIASLKEAQQEVPLAQEAFQRAFAIFAVENSRVLHEIAAWPRFREAVTWQNRKAVHTALDTLLRAKVAGSLTSKTRQDEELVTRYLQRYCAKNDTIGFFGPMGWAEFISSGKALVACPGPELLESRKVYFESWPIEALAKKIAYDSNVYAWIVPIRMPFIRVEGSILHHPLYGATRIPAEQATILRACDGNSPAKWIARAVLRNASAPLRSETQVYKMMAELAGKGLLFWEFNIPFEAHPERRLREALQRIEEPGIRRNALSMLDELELAREDLAACAGDPERLDTALSHMEETFTRLTGVSSTRGEGQTYAGRTIIYEDCRRDIKVELGPELLESIARPISLLLAAARWLTWEFADVFRKKFRKIYGELSRATVGSAVDAAVFFQHAKSYLFAGKEDNLGLPVQQEFQKKWERILKIDASREELHYSSENLREQVLQEFAAPRAGWGSARYHSPDIMIIAASQEAVQNGDYMLAMGEFHIGGNTLASGLFVNQHPAPEDLVRAVEEDMGSPHVVGIPPRDTPELLARTASALVPDSVFRLEYGKDGFTSNRAKALPISALVIEDQDGQLTARTRDRRLQFDIIEVLGGLFHVMVVDSFRMLGTKPHTPRIFLDRLVIKRESWRFSAQELTFAQQKHSAERFLGARRWAIAHDLPRFNFFKVPIERKPAYLDLESPALIDVFCKMVRRMLEAKLSKATVEVTEMLPAMDGLWLRDSAGQCYTSELRIVAVDLIR